MLWFGLHDLVIKRLKIIESESFFFFFPVFILETEIEYHVSQQLFFFFGGGLRFDNSQRALL